MTPGLETPRPRTHRRWIESGFLAALFVLCLSLTALQYRWTGEVGRAEAARLRTSLSEQGAALARAFDTELAEACAALKPSHAELRESDCVNAFHHRWRDWKAGRGRPMFRKVGVAVPVGREPRLFLPDDTTGGAVRSDWPADWTPLREFAARVSWGGPPNLADRSGEFLEFPIFGGHGGGDRGRGERGWLLVQLDLDYLRTTWMPELVRSHLGATGAQPWDLTVTAAGSGRVLFSTRPGAGPAGEAIFGTRLHRDGQASGPSGDRIPGRRTGMDSGLWNLEIHQHPGTLEGLVSRSRWRNLGVASLVNILILAAGTALFLHTRRSLALARERMEFVATVSHELRTPLTVIRGAGHNLSRGIAREPAQIEEYSRLIVQHAERLGDLVEQTLALAGAGRSTGKQRRERVELRVLVEEAIAAVAEDVHAARCEVELNLPGSLPAVTGDPAALRRVFQNLVANAAKHGGEGRWIGVSAAAVTEGVVGRVSSPSPSVEVCVSDRGSGIPKGERTQIFTPFFRGAAARHRQTRGSGLGLSVVREIVEAHGGTVSVMSERSGGTTFAVRLPIARDSDA